MSDLPAGFELENNIPPGFELEPVVNPSAQSPAAQSVGLTKQGAGSILEAITGAYSAPPKALKEIGSAISAATGLPEPQPIINAPPSPEAQINAAVGAPQSGAEELARNFTAFPFSAAFGPKAHLGENIAGGIGAGLGAYYGPQVAGSLGATPEEGSIVGALTGGLTGAKAYGINANRVARNLMPKPQEVLDAAGDIYSNLRQSNRAIIVPPDAMNVVKKGILSVLKSQGPSEEDAKEVYSIINGLDTDNGGTVADLINARKNLTGHFQGGPDANKPAALLALEIIDPLIDRVGSPGTLARLKEADANWSAARTAQAVDTKISQAEDRAEGANSGMNRGNNIIQNINAYIKSRTDNIGKVHMAPSDLAALDQVRKLDLGQQTLRMLSGAAGGGGGRDLLAGAGLGAIGALGINQAGLNATDKGDPLIAGAGVPALGLLGRRFFNSSVARTAKNAESAILARAPYVQSLGLNPPRPLLSGPQIAARSLFFAAPALRNQLAPQDAQ